MYYQHRRFLPSKGFFKQITEIQCFKAMQGPNAGVNFFSAQLGFNGTYI